MACLASAANGKITLPGTLFTKIFLCYPLLNSCWHSPVAKPNISSLFRSFLNLAVLLSHNRQLQGESWMLSDQGLHSLFWINSSIIPPQVQSSHCCSFVGVLTCELRLSSFAVDNQVAICSPLPFDHPTPSLWSAAHSTNYVVNVVLDPGWLILLWILVSFVVNLEGCSCLCF